MKKLNKKDYVLLLILFIIIMSFVIILRVKGFGFGSNVDWISQHVTIPEYFRMIFYETKDLFPKFNLHLGMGQNIFYFFYYGLFNPIILIAYLLPFIKMVDYIQIISIVNIFISVYLLYKWINNKYNSKVGFIASLIFLLSGPLIYHSHRHIMFVNYMPFLIGALMGVDQYFAKKKPILLIINTFLIILTSFYFSIPSIIVIGIYSLYKILEKKKIDFKPLFKIIFYVVISILLTSFVLVPIVYALFTGRSNSTAIINFKDLLLPAINYNSTFYYTYSLGLTFIYVVSLVHNILLKKKNNIFLGIVLLICILFPCISYLLNGFMYIDGKSFIPFLPLALIIISNFLKNLFENKVDFKKLILIIIPISIFMIYSAVDYNKIYLLIFDISIVIIFLLIIAKFKKNNLIIIPIILVSLITFIVVNNNESYVNLNTIKEENNPVYKELLDQIEEKNIYRTLINDSILNKTNKIYSINQYNTSIYSSASNQKYLSFVRDIFSNEVINKDYSTITGTNNILFNIYSGTKYLIDKDVPLIGYQEINNIDNYILYENNDVLPLGYSSSNIMSLREFNTLEYPYNIDALLNYIIIDRSLSNVYKTNINSYDLVGEFKDINNINYDKTDNGYKINSKKGSVNYLLNTPLKNKILIIKFDMNKSKDGYYCDSNITINGIKNSLSCESWKYHNNNYTFEYVISSVEDINNLSIKFSDDDFEISNIETYTIDYDNIKNIKGNISELFIDKSKSTNNYLYGEINVKENGYIKLTIPYQKRGFNIYIDGIKTDYHLADKTFIGFEIERGNHIVEIKFNPPYLKLGILLSLIGILLFSLTIIYNRIKKHLSNFYKLLHNYVAKLYNNIVIFLIMNKGYIYLFISLLILDLFLRIYSYPNIKFYNFYHLAPNLFTITWIILILNITKLLKSWTGKTIYLTYYIFYLIVFLVQAIYFTYFKTFFDFSIIKLAEEGASYLDSVLLNIKYPVIIITILSIFLTIKGLKQIEHKNKFKIKRLLIITIIFAIVYSLLPFTLGSKRSSLEWDDWRNPRSIYHSFNDNNKSLMVSGLFEYTVRDLYTTYIKNNNELTEEEKDVLKENFDNTVVNIPNNYTGIFEGKNLILIQLESIDNFLITNKIMPTTYKLMRNSINFTNHYSFTSGGGSTFNSEFMVNVGYSTAYNYNQSAYSFSKNDYKYSLPNLLKKYNYESNAFHMNNGEYYSRAANYKSFGYNNYYGLKGQSVYKNNDDYWLDRELILNKEFNQSLYKSDDLFMNYIITYSAHMPFKSSKGTCSKLTTDEGLTELECLKIQATETDYFVELLIKDLKEKELLDNTVLVFFSDHYLYTLEDQTILDKYKNTDNHLINHTPFFIWSNNEYKRTIKSVNSQLDILPTILNLMGIEYNPNYYLGRDILSKDFKPIVYFADGSWYNGQSYIKNGEYLNGKKISEEDINEINSYIKRKMILNDAVLKSDYFKNK